MSDPYKTTTKQEEDILFKAKQRGRARTGRDGAANQIVAADIKSMQVEFGLARNDLEYLEYSRKLLDELEAAEFEFAHVETTAEDEPTLCVVFDRHYNVWKPLYKEKKVWENLLRTNTSFLGVLERTHMWGAFQSALVERSLRANPVQLNGHLNGIPFSNGVFDFELGGLRGYRATDGRTFLGSEQYVDDGTDSTLTNGLIRMMAAGDENKEKLIRAVCWLHLTGIHNLGWFKSGFIIWACPGGNSGRSTLFDLIGLATGGQDGAGVPLNSLSDLQDPNNLAKLRGRNYVIVDEANTVTSAKSQAISTLKSIVGCRNAALNVKVLYQNRETIHGHWIVSQALNSFSLLYGADEPLLNRTVALVTESIPQGVIDAYKADRNKRKRSESMEEACAFVRSLWREFGNAENAAFVVDELKGLYNADIRSLVDVESPITEFCSTALLEKAGHEVSLGQVTELFNKWLAKMYPTNRPKSVKAMSKELAEAGYSVIKQTSGAKLRVVVGVDLDLALLTY